MHSIRRGNERGHFNHGWLDTYHSFSFAEYQDPEHMGFASLRVINDDTVAPAQGFGTHGHRDMEIITYILDGALEHKDNMGNGSVIRPGDVQRMSAGTGVMHSEFNPSKTDSVHLLQIWILPDTQGAKPGYEEKHFDAESKRGRLRLVASKGGREGSVSLNQDANIFAALLDGPQSVEHGLANGRRAYLHVARGKVTVNGEKLTGGDAMKISGETAVRLEQAAQAEVLLFDLA
jgi:redox-sensitive bicupin YhaK (pirin superfamily)